MKTRLDRNVRKRFLPEGITWCSVERNPGKRSVPGIKSTDELRDCLHTCILR